MWPCPHAHPAVPKSGCTIANEEREHVSPRADTPPTPHGRGTGRKSCSVGCPTPPLISISTRSEPTGVARRSCCYRSRDMPISRRRNRTDRPSPTPSLREMTCGSRPRRGNRCVSWKRPSTNMRRYSRRTGGSSRSSPTNRGRTRSTFMPTRTLIVDGPSRARAARSRPGRRMAASSSIGTVMP